jgi:hypothetical protein
MKLPFILTGALFAFACSALAETLVWKTEKSLGELLDLPTECNPQTDESCPDYVPYAQNSKFGVTYYLTYHEGTRVSIGFGRYPNEANQVFAYMLHPGAFDWGGRFENGKFVPRYVIKRFYKFDDSLTTAEMFFKVMSGKVRLSQSDLSIYRLTPSGGACLVLAKMETSDILVARKMAQQDMMTPHCMEPWIPAEGPRTDR